jgi:predicted GIY-YIG superfamily endonuclease
MGSDQSTLQTEPSLWEDIKANVSQSIESFEQQRREDIVRYQQQEAIIRYNQQQEAIARYHRQQEDIARYHRQQEAYRLQRKRDEAIAKQQEAYRLQREREAILRYRQQQEETIRLQREAIARQQEILQREREEAVARYHQQEETNRLEREREEIARYQEEAIRLQRDEAVTQQTLQRQEEPSSLMNYFDDFLKREALKQRREEEPPKQRREEEPPKQRREEEPPKQQSKDVIYVLELSQDKWYVGRTSNFERRYTEHESGNGSVWSKTYLPILSHSLLPCTSNLQEDLVVKEYMLKYSIDNVRGGAYSMITLDANQRNLLERELSHASNKCFKCGSKDHYANKCPKETKIVTCYKCKKPGHYANRCDDVKPKNFCSSCGRKEHEGCDNECEHKKDRDGNPNGMSSYCKRCGRDSHLYPKCYAKSTYKGLPL